MVALFKVKYTYLLAVCLSLVALNLNSFAADPQVTPRATRVDKAPAKKETLLPPLRIVNKPKESVEDAFGTMFVSNPVVTSFPGRIVSGKDITEFELAVLKAIMDGSKGAQFQFDPKVPTKRRFLINKRYHPGDLRILDVYKRALDEGYDTIGQISHLDDALDVKFNPGEKFQKSLTTQTVTPKSNENGQVIQALLDMKFGWATGGKLPKHFVAGPPPTNREVIGVDGRVALMHEKAWIIGELNADGTVSRAFAIKGTANEVPHKGAGTAANESTRYNRAFTVRDADFAKYIAEVALDNARGYSNGQQIDQLANKDRLQIRYKDGILEQGYTHNKHNMNARDAALMLLSIKQVQDPKTKVVEKVDQAWVDKQFDRDVAGAYKEYSDPFYGVAGWVPSTGFDSDFVETYSPGHRIEQQMIQDNPKFMMRRLVDNQFIDPAGFGLVTATQGISVRRPMGGTVRGWSAKEAAQVKVWVYQRWVGTQVELEGAPVNVYLQHDKTGGKQGISAAGKPLAILRTGSFNRSNAELNAEDQLLFIGSPSSWLYQGIQESVEYIVKNEPQYAIPYMDALQRDLYAHITGRSPQQLPLLTSRKIAEMVSYGEMDKAYPLLMAVAVEEPYLTKKMPLDERKKQVDRLFAFFRWHFENYKDLYGARGQGGQPAKSASFYLRKNVDPQLILANPTMGSSKKAWALRDALWAPGLDKDAIEQRAAEVWKLLEIPGDMPAKDALEKNQGEQ